jgi:hypothetical protein
LEALSENQAKLQIAYLSLPLLMLGTIICFRICVHFLAEPTKLLAFAAVFLPVSLVIATVMLVREHANKTQERIQQLSLSAFRPAMQWLDLYSTCDPVPNGPLTNPGRLDHFETRAVTNTGSLLHDHTSYWDNQSEVIAYILRKIDDQLKLGLFGENDLNLQVAARQHRRAVLWRVGIWWANVAAALLIILQPNLSAWFGSMPSRKLPAWGESIQHFFAVGAPATLGKSLAVVGEVLAWVAGKPIPEELTTLLLGAMVPIALLAIWYLAFRLIWKWLDGFTTRQVLDPGVPSNRKAEALVLKPLVIAAGLVPFILAGIFVVRPEWLEAHLEEEFYRGLASVVAFWITATFLLVVISTAISVIRAKNAKERIDNLLTLLYASALTFFFCTYLVPNRTLIKLKDLAMVLLVFILSFCAIALWHRSLVQRAGPRPGHVLRWWTVLLLPFCLFLFPLSRLRTLGPWNEVPPAFVGAYMFGVSFAWIIVKISTRRDRRDSIALDTQEQATTKAAGQ